MRTKIHCIQCDLTATRRDNLLNHVRNIHEGFSCEKCKYIAGTRQHLQRHVKGVHEGIKRIGTPRKRMVMRMYFCLGIIVTTRPKGDVN